MATQILMPALSPTMKDGTLARWLKKEGDQVKSGDILAEIETDKATMEVEAVDEGILGKILVPGGSKGVPINEVIGLLIEKGEKIEDIKIETSSKGPAQAETLPPKETGVQAPQSKPSSNAERIIASPLAKRIAEQNQVELKEVSGTGPHGRIIKVDVENALAASQNKTPSPSVMLSDENKFEFVPHTTMREAIARRLVEAKQTIPHFYLTLDCEMGNLLALRKNMNESLNAKISVNDFLIRAVGLALEKNPKVNASWTNDGMKYYKNADISIAVAIEGGLITPILKAANLKSVSIISGDSKSLIEKARTFKLKPHEYEGGTFSLSNLGMFGIREFSAIINPPQSCILAVGGTEQRVVVKNGQIVTADIMICTLSCDHRVVDGALGAEFLKTFKTLIENPISLLM
jgi:pyruvate dehydrogenase E2 component (dihydrolipoamide acetyltransferase)